MTNRRYERGLALILLLWLACCFKANAQTPVSPISTPRYVPRDTNGNTLPGGKVCVFSAGTTTPLTSYSESTGTSANTNPVTLDSAGAANIWVQSQAYKIIVYSSVGADSNCPNAGVSQFSIDGINPGALGNTAITGTLSVSGKITPTGGIVGKTDASSASAGNIGELLSATAGPVSLSTTVAANITSVSLTAGDWDVSASCLHNVSVAATYIRCTVSTTTATVNTLGDGSTALIAASSATIGGSVINTGTIRVNISSPTTYFLNADATFGSGNDPVTGTIRARRVR